MSDLPSSYWSDVQPTVLFLKETFQKYKRSVIESGLGKLIDRKEIDPFMINEASEFLRLSIINSLAYKRLVCGNYLAWGRVTAYYSQFYIANCLLRLKGFALVHLDFVEDQSSITVTFVKPREKPHYIMQKCKAGGHDMVWNNFAKMYPNLCNEVVGKFYIKERTDWNYDLFYASQSTNKYALRHSQIRCQYNFLDPHFRSSSTPEEAEHFDHIISSAGIEEIGTGHYQKYAIEKLSAISKDSKHSDWYRSFFSKILEDIEIVDSPKSMKEVISLWFQEAIAQITF